MEPEVLITGAQVVNPDGTVAATIDLVRVGGGTRTVNVDGNPEERVSPASTVYHVRFLSPNRMVPDELREVDYYETAVGLACEYAKKLDEHAERVAALAADLKV